MPPTGGWSNFITIEVGEYRPGDAVEPASVVLRAISFDGEAVGNVRSIRFVPAEG